MRPYTGTCWKLPDAVSSDQLIGPAHVFDFEAETLRKHLLDDRDLDRRAVYATGYWRAR